VASEALLAYELGYRVEVGPELALSVATFYNDYRDLRSLAPLNPPAAFPVEISSGLEGESAGAELSADWRAMANWRLRAGYTELRVSSELQAGSADRSSSRSIAADPNHQFALHSLLDLSSSWEFDSTLRYVGPITNEQVPGYTELDLRLGWRPAPAWELSIDGQNLLHNHHAEFNSPGSRREIERSVYTRASWRF
jgi:iron complex outermembrane receptor protein